MPYSTKSSFSWSFRDTSQVTVSASRAETYEATFLSFLASAQALDIQFLPITWDAGREDIGFGATSTINEAIINLHTSFAFKRVNRKMKANEIFQALLNEIQVLCQPFVRKHASIAQLQGICWDVSPADDTPWPVLVFEKTHFGDVHSFLRLKVSRDITFSERQKLCLDVGKAISDMHRNNIVHGDIKPQNVLVFKDGMGNYGARVIDFGYSALYADDDSLIRMPITHPWNAPEHDRPSREWSPSEAKRADIFSIGMFFLWVLFEKYFSGITPIPRRENLSWAADIFPSQTVEPVNGIATLSRLRGFTSQLPLLSRQLLESEADLGTEERAALQHFLSASLGSDPENRQGSLEKLLRSLDNYRSVSLGNLKATAHGAPSIDFKIEKSMTALYACDYRVRSYIFQCLEEEHNAGVAVDEQLAICYYLGFGTTRDQSKAAEILHAHNRNVTALRASLIHHLSQDSRHHQPQKLNQLVRTGFLPAIPTDTFYRKQRNLDSTELWLLREVDDLTDALGANNVAVSLLQHILARIYEVQGRWKEAEELELVVKARNSTAFGNQHPSTLSSLSNLATTLWGQGRWKEAEELELQVLQTSSKVLGEEHPLTMSSGSSLASTYRAQNRLKDAESLQAKHLLTRQRVLGEDHPETLESMSTFSSILWDQARWKEAEEIDTRAQALRTRVLGEEHPDTAVSMGNLAAALWSQGRWTEAEELETKVIDVRRRVLGEDHPDTLNGMANLAATYTSQARFKEAEDLEKRVLQSRRRVLGEKHPATLLSMSNLASTYRYQGLFGDAAVLLEEAMDIGFQVSEADHPELLICIGGLALALLDGNRVTEAESMLDGVARALKKSLGERHPDTLTAINAQVSVLARRERWDEAEELQKTLLETTRSVLHDRHPKTLTEMCNLAYVWKRVGKDSDALALIQQCSSLQGEVLGPDHPDTRSSIELAVEWSSNQS